MTRSLRASSYLNNDMMSEKEGLLYERNSEDFPEGFPDLPLNLHSKTPSLPRTIHIALLYIINITLLFGVVFIFHSKSYDPALQLYSPANSAIEYEVQAIAGGFARKPYKTSYLGPPDNDTDRLWEDLYQVGVSVISKEEADRLPQKADPILEHPDKYAVILSVFHELHCLNRIRKPLYPEIYGPIIYPDGTKDMKMMVHLDHCVDLLRQTLMCQSDLSVGFFKRTEDEGYLPQPNVMRVCRKFENVQAWAREHHADIPVI